MAEPLELVLDVDNLTLGQTDFLETYTGRTTEELADVLQNKKFRSRDLIAIAALSMRPDDPEAGIELAKQIKITDMKS